MKSFSVIFFMFSFSAYSAIEALNFKILPGKFHLGGKASAVILSTDTQRGVMIVKLDYEVIKKALVPVPNEYLKGGLDQELPLEFSDERGYLNLEKQGTMDLPEATLIHLGRVSIGNHQQGHRVKIKAKNGRSETDVYYHPHLPELGWGKVGLLLHTPIPMLKDYSLEAVLQ